MPPNAPHFGHSREAASFNTLLQQIAWDTVSTHLMSGVMKPSAN